MKNTVLFSLVSCCLYFLSFADIPVEQFQGVYARSPRKEFSPLWGEILLKSNVLTHMRFYGNYGSKPIEGLPPSPALDGQHEFNCPQDPVAALIQHAFPSRAGGVLACDGSVSRPFGKIALNKDFVLLNKILKVAIKASGGDTQSVNELDALLPGISSRDCRNILKKAFLYEDKGKLYPPHIAIHVLLAFACRIADHISQLEALDSVLEPGPRHLFSTDEYYEELPRLIAQLKEHASVSPENIFLFYKMYQSSVNPIPDLVAGGLPTTYTPPGASAIKYYDCGETSLRNLFYTFLNSRGQISEDALEGLDSNLKKDPNPAFLNTYEAFVKFLKDRPNLSVSRTDPDRTAWSQVVSDLNNRTANQGNEISYIKERVCEIGPGLINMLSVIEKLVPDKQLSVSWTSDEKENFKIAARKLTRLCELFSRPGFKLRWSCNNSELILDDKTVNIEFSINGIREFYWDFLPIHFEIKALPNVKKDWRDDFSFQDFKDPLIQNLFVTTADLEKFPEVYPYNLWGLKLDLLDPALATVGFMARKKWGRRWPLVQMLVGRNVINLEDPYVCRKVIEMLWKLRIPNKDDLTLEFVPSLKMKECLFLEALKAHDANLASFLIHHGVNVEKLGTEGKIDADRVLREALWNTDSLALLAENGIKVSTKDIPYTVRLAAQKGDVALLRSVISQATDHTKAEALNDAMKLGQLKTAKVLLQNGASIKNCDRWPRTGFTLLMEGAEKGNVKAVELLLKHGADVNATHSGKTALFYALKENHFDVVELLQKHGTQMDQRASYSALISAIRRQDLGSVKRLLALGVKACPADDAGRPFSPTPLQEVPLSNPAMAIELLKHGATGGNVFLMNAAQAKNANTVKEIVGYDPQLGEMVLSSILSKTFSADMRTQQRDLADAAMLIDSGTDLNAPGLKGLTPLMWAANNGNVPAVELLVKKGADINFKNKEGHRAFQYIQPGYNGRGFEFELHILLDPKE